MPKTTKKTTKKRLKIKDLPGAKGDLSGKEMKKVKGGADHRDRTGINKFTNTTFDDQAVTLAKK